jgi:AbrB family looped-hinge helix DNA binding protein
MEADIDNGRFQMRHSTDNVEEPNNVSGAAVKNWHKKGGLQKNGKADNHESMNRSFAVKHSGHVGRRGAIVLPSSVRKRYGLQDGSLFISEEREDGVLIRPAMATPVDLSGVRLKIRQGIQELDEGKGIPGDQAEAELKAMSKAFRARRRK